VTLSEWHRKPFLPCREYYPVGNRHLSAIVQVDDSGPGAPLAIVFQDPDLFGGGLGMKGDAFMFDPQR